MNEEATMYLDLSKESMSSTIDHLETALSHIRAGKANVHILDEVLVNYYGNNVPLSQCANVSTPDARTITVLPWEKNLLKDIEKAIIDSNVGIMPDNNGEIIRIGIPQLTEERRKVLVKDVRTTGENAKISIRNARREAIDEIKKLVKDGLAEDMGKDAESTAQQIHDDYIKKLDTIITAKEKEIMTV